MRLCRRRSRAAVVLLLLVCAALVFLSSHVSLLLKGDVITGHDVRRKPSHVEGSHRQSSFKDLAVKDRSSLLPRPLVHRVEPEIVERRELEEEDTTSMSPNATDNSFEQRHWMTIHGGGRLGNAMFQYASLVGISSYHGYGSKLQASHSLRRIFKLRSKYSNYGRPKTRSKRERSPGIFDHAFLGLSHDTNWTLIGYFQSWKYFGNISDKIRDEFTFRDSVIKEMIEEVPMVANWSRLTVGVHVRRGDMTSPYERDRGYSVASLGFIKRAMNYFRKNYDNPIFLICSDSVTWCKENLMSNDTIFLNGRREVDLATLAHCNHNIVTSGSFGWWGAWLAGGDVVYYKHFPREKSWLDRQYVKDDYYPQSWIGMD